MNDPRRILIIATVSLTVETFLNPHITAMQERGYWVGVASSGPIRGRRVADQYFDVPFSRSAPDLRSHLSALRSIKAVLDDLDPDMVEVHTPIAATLARLAARKKCTVLYFCHGLHFQAGEMSPWLSIEKAMRGLTHHIAVINGEDRNQAIARIGYAPEDVTLLPGVGCEVETFAVARNVALNPPFVLAIGRLSTDKQPLMALRSFEEGDFGDHELWFAGDGELRDELSRAVAMSPKASKVRLLGQTDDVPNLLSRASALLHLSRREGMGMVLVEACAAGLPVVSLDRRGMRDVLDGYPGWFRVRDESHDAAANALQSALSRDRVEADIARKHVERFSVEAAVASHLALVDELMSKPEVA